MTAAIATETCVACGGAVAGRTCACGTPLFAGRFRIQAVIARNGHSRVYRAVGPNRAVVALKELAFAFAPDARAVDLFEREAALLKSLTIPGIPRFVDAFQEGEGAHLRLYLAQELIIGAPLDVALSHGPLQPPEVVHIAREVLETLNLLHTHDPPVFHRDIKPANLIRGAYGRISLVDLGAARISHEGATHGATLVGTFGYMPPEQLGGTVDETSDLYALGATLLHLATGRAPETFFSEQDQWRGFDLRRAKLSPELRALLTRLLETDRRRRFPSAAAALKSLQGEPIPQPPRFDPRPGVFVFLGGIGILMAAWFFTSLQRPVVVPPVVVRKEEAVPPIAPIEAPAPVAPKVTLAPEDLPTVGISLSETFSKGGGVPLNVAENAITQKWTDVGFRFKPFADRLVRFPAATDVVILGTAISIDQGNLGDLLGKGDGATMYSCKGVISLKAFDGRSGFVLATVQADKTTMHISSEVCALNAIRRSTDLASEELQKKLLETWKPRKR